MKRFETCLKENNIKYVKNQPLSELSTFKLGGTVKFLLLPKSYDELSFTIGLLEEFKYKYFTLGNGSNVLFTEKPPIQAVLSLKEMPKVLYAEDQKVIVSAGVNLFELHKFLKDNELEGFEFAYGIPATVGGAVKGNAGAFDKCVCDYLSSVCILNPKSRQIRHLDAKDIHYSYRQTDIDGIILSATFKFEKGNYYNIASRQNDYYQKRRETQPFNKCSAGSIFKRDGDIIPALLIDRLGLKGFRHKGAMVSDKHAGFIVKADETCTSKDVVELIKIIKKEVEKQYNIYLKEEILII